MKNTRDVLRYLDKGIVGGAASRRLDDAVNAVKNNEERRREYMVMMAREMEIREEGREEGREQGASLLGALITRLMSQNRLQDVERAASDSIFRKQLYSEFGME